MEGLGSYFGGNYSDFIKEKEKDEEEFVGIIGSEIEIPSTIPVNSHAEQPIIGSVEPLEITSPISTEPAKDFTDVKSKIDYYEEKITWLEGIAEEKGGLGESGYDAYRYATSQYNILVSEYNKSISKEIPAQKEVIPRAMQRTGVIQRQRGLGEVPEYEIDTKEMPKAIKIVDDWMQGAMKGIPKAAISMTSKAIGQLLTAYGDQLEIYSQKEQDVINEELNKVNPELLEAIGVERNVRTKLGGFTSEQGQRLVSQSNKWANKFLLEEDASKLERWSADFHAGGTSFLGALGWSVLAKDPAAASTAFGLLAYGSTYEAAVEAGVDKEKASTLGLIHQVNETATEFLGLTFLLSKLGLGKFGNALIKGGMEYLQEYWQTSGENLVAIYGWDNLRKWNENASRSGEMGFLWGGGAGAVIDYVSEQENAPRGIIKPLVERAYQETLKFTENIDHQDIIDSTQDYEMDIDPTATERYEDFLDRPTEEILDQIDEREFEKEIPEQYTEESDAMIKAEEERITEVEEYEFPKEIETGKPYTVTVYRGTKEGVPPVDEGLFGKGTYYTTNREYAETYGKVEPSVVNLKKPFVIETQKEADAFWNETTRPAKKKAIAEGKTPKEANEIAAIAARKYLEDKGYDGLIARDIIAEGDEVVVFYPTEVSPKVTFAEGEITELAVTDVGTPALAEYGLEVSEVEPPTIPPKRERKEWEPVGLPPKKADVPDTLMFKEPVLTKWYTPKMELMRQMGVDKILGNLPEASGLMEIKTTELTHEVNELIKKLNKDRGIKERFGTWIKNKPSKQVADLRDLLNRYENAPDFLTFEEKTRFNEVRDLTRGLLKITNEFRVAAGLPEIHNLEAYVPHFLDEVARAAANGMYPYVADVYRWTGKKLPKKGTNPTARKRTVDKLTDDLNEVFSKDLGMLLKAMIKYDLRDVYLAIPYAQVRANIDSLKGQIPTKVLQELEEYIEYDIFDHQTDLDKIINLTVDRAGITPAVNSLLKPFGRVMTNPVRLFSSTYRQGLMGGAITGKPRIVLRNLFQRLLTIDFVAPIDLVKAQFYAPEWQMEKIRDTYFYKKSIQSFEDLPLLIKPVQWGMYPFQKSHAGMTYLSNIDVAMRAGWWSGQRNIDWCQSDKGQAYIKDYIAKRPHLTEQQKEDLIWREGDQVQEAVEVGSYTQWAYFSQEMPRVFRGQGARAFWSLQSWTMNYFGKHVPEMCRRTFKGMTGRGRVIAPAERWRAAKGLATLFAILTALKEVTGIDMVKFAFFPFPTVLTPHLGQLLYNTYNYFLAVTDPEKRKTAWSKLKSSLRLLLPFSGAVKRYVQMLRGDITIKEWLFYMERNDDWKQIWIKDKPKPEVTVGDFEGLIGEEGIIGEDDEVIGEEGIIGEE